MSPAVSDATWNAQDTTPSAVEAALRRLLAERHAEAPELAPARTVNLICIVDRDWSGEIANRLRRIGRAMASRTVVVAFDDRHDRLDARATIASVEDGEGRMLRETVVLDVGPGHCSELHTIVDPLVVTDLPTVLWSPHGHRDAVEQLLHLVQVVLVDSVDEPEPREGLDRSLELLRRGNHVVDLAWLRSTPWRERVAATFDRRALLRDLWRLSKVEVRHAPDSQAAALLLVGWMASRLGWSPAPLHGGRGVARTRKQDVRVVLQSDPSMPVRGLAGLTLETANGRHFSLDRGRGGLQAAYTNRRGDERSWTVLGASRGEAGVLGEGIRQALLRDRTYRPALEAARVFAG